MTVTVAYDVGTSVNALVLVVLGVVALLLAETLTHLTSRKPHILYYLATMLLVASAVVRVTA